MRANEKGSDGDFDIEWRGIINERDFARVWIYMKGFRQAQDQCEILWIVGTLWPRADAVG